MFRSCKLDNNIKIEDKDASEGDRVDDVGADTQILEDVNDGHNINCEYDDDDAATDDDDEDDENDDDDDDSDEDDNDEGGDGDNDFDTIGEFKDDGEDSVAVGFAADNEYGDDIKYDGDDGTGNEEDEEGNVNNNGAKDSN